VDRERGVVVVDVELRLRRAAALDEESNRVARHHVLGCCVRDRPGGPTRECAT
jgi:hypothetical protein